MSSRCPSCNWADCGTARFAKRIASTVVPCWRAIDAFIDMGRIDEPAYATMVLTDGGGVDNFPLAAAAEVPTERVLGMRSWPNTEPVVFDPHAVHGRTYLARALMSPLVALESVQFAAHPAALQARVVTFGTEGVSGAEFYAGPEVCRALWWTGLWTMYQAIDPARGTVLNVVVSALAVHLTARRGALVERALARTMRQARLPRADEAAPVGITSLET